jgi:hypothetical protein
MKKSISLSLLVVSLLVPGCAPAIPFKTGSPIREDQVKMIMVGKTTKNDLFEWFGAPMAAAARNEIAVISSPTIWTHAPGMMTGGSYSIESNAFFELFAQEHDLNEYHRIYYFDYTASYRSAYIFVLAFYESGYTKSDRLWVLMNEKTGLVEDFAFKKYGEKVVFGRAKDTLPH